MFKIEELSGQLIKSGRFKEVIRKFLREINLARDEGVITENEWFGLHVEFCELLLVPDAYCAKMLGDKMIQLMLRIPGVLPAINEEEFEKNVDESRETP